MPRNIKACFNRIFEENLHGSHLKCPKGFKRGIDVITDDLFAKFRFSCKAYANNHGRQPNVISPVTFTEKQVLFKFFGLIPEQSPSDKLRSPGFLPKDYRDYVKVPRKIWVSDNYKLPENDEIEAGDYYLKSNHSSGTNCPDNLPSLARAARPL